MDSTIQEPQVLSQTKELCKTITEQPEFKSIRSRIDAFLNREDLRSKYDVLMMKGQALQQKQQQGLPLDDEEVAELEKGKNELIAHKETTEFFDAQDEIHTIQNQVFQYVIKTFELGRVPEDHEFDTCCNNEGCGCD